MAQPNYYVYCFVPHCKNTNISNPEKLFFNVPQGERRKEWCAAVGRDSTGISLTTERRCCQDHFKIEEDVENWLSYRILRDCDPKNLPKLRLKKNVVPHLFPSKSNFRKSGETERGMDADSTEQEDLQPEDIHTLCSVEMGNISEDSSDDSTSQSPETISSKDQVKTQPADVNFHQCLENVNFGEGLSTSSSPQGTREIQSKHAETDVPAKSSRCSAMKKRLIETRTNGCSSDTNDVISVATRTSQSSLGAPEEQLIVLLRTQYVSFNVYLMEKSPKRHLGLDVEKLGLIKTLQEFTGCSKIDILISLRKIRKNESLDDLEEIFYLDKSSISTSIRKTIPLLSSYLSRFIYWPEPKSGKNNLNVANKVNYTSVQCVIFCFEVVTMKSSDSVVQSLTWSENKSHNSVKFFISITPDGFINFVSKGFDGKTADLEIVKNSGFLDHLKPGMVVMASRGFKETETLFLEKKCSLVRPPIVSIKSKMTKGEATQSKVVASLRVNVERVIRCVREFILFSYPPFHYDLLDLIDQCIIIACALINTQSPVSVRKEPLFKRYLSFE